MRIGALREDGQSTIEFTLVLILLLAFVFFFVQLSLVFGWSSYIQYATYLSARAYVSAGPDKSGQLERAEKVIRTMIRRGDVERAPFLARDVSGPPKVGTGAGFVENAREFSWLEGVQYSFRSKIFLLPLGKKGLPASESNFLRLTSETWLSREPTEVECLKDMAQGGKKRLIDNGC